MFILKPNNTNPNPTTNTHTNTTSQNPLQGNYVDNFRRTIEILSDSCKYVPKTAFKRTLVLPQVVIPVASQCSSHLSTTDIANAESRFPSVSTVGKMTRSLSSQAVIELEMEIEADDFVYLDEPVGISVEP